MDSQMRALQDGLDDAAEGRDRHLPTWIMERYGQHSDEARIYDQAYTEEKEARGRAARHAKR